MSFNKLIGQDTSPPQPRFALNIGVIGHRPNRLHAAAEPHVRQAVDEALRQIAAAAHAALERHASFFSADRPALTLLSGLAEGADNIAASLALERGFKLSAVLPFPADEYERDFVTAEAQQGLRRLLDSAGTAITPCGTRENEARAYEAAGETIVHNSDVIIAVWDGGGSAGRGGTAELLVRAAAARLPIVHVDAKGRSSARILWAEFSSFPAADVGLDDLPSRAFSQIGAVIESIVRPPEEQEEAKKLRSFLTPAWQPRIWRIEMPALLAMLGVRAFRRSDFLPPQPGELADRLQNGACSPLDERTLQRLRPALLAYGWADAIAVRSAQAFRSAYSLNFLFAALAVLMAAAPLVPGYVWDWPKWPFVLVEVLLVLVVIVNTIVGRRRNWHGIWLETRELAERMRAGIPPWLAGTRPWSFPGPERTWTGWYSRAHFRAVSPRAARYDDLELAAVQQTILNLIDDQCRYHEGTAARFREIEDRIESLGEVFFGLTLLVALSYLTGAALGLPSPTWWSYTVTALTATLPAFGAASYGVRLVGDFESTARRSAETGATLATLGRAIQDERPSLQSLRRTAAQASDAMLRDVSRWRLVSETRGLTLPG